MKKTAPKVVAKKAPAKKSVSKVKGKPTHDDLPPLEGELKVKARERIEEGEAVPIIAPAVNVEPIQPPMPPKTDAQLAVEKKAFIENTLIRIGTRARVILQQKRMPPEAEGIAALESLGQELAVALWEIEKLKERMK